MAVNLKAPEVLAPVSGVELATVAAGIRYQGRDDLLLLRLAPGSKVAARFTRNAFCAAPVTLAREHLAARGDIGALLINAGNANAGTGAAGLAAARATCAAAAAALQLAPEQILPFSTGVIGNLLPVEPFERHLPGLAAALTADAWLPAARAIMTTDTVAKGQSLAFEADGHRYTVTGIAKGSGMIRPDMATLLAFVATDAPVAADCLNEVLDTALAGSFNAITVDGDTSTNDAGVLAATGAAGGPEIRAGSAAAQALQDAVSRVCETLAQACIRDAEGATRFITVAVDGAVDIAEARKVAYTVAESPLVKTAAFAADANWGRILAAVGRSGLAALDIARVDLSLDDVRVLAGGEPAPDYREERGAAVVSRAEYTIRIALGRGDACARVWTSDLSHDYVKINAAYRS